VADNPKGSAEAYIDVDGSIAGTGVNAKGHRLFVQGCLGYHPLIVSLANTKEVLYLLNVRQRGQPRG